MNLDTQNENLCIHNRNFHYGNKSRLKIYFNAHGNALAKLRALDAKTVLDQFEQSLTDIKTETRYVPGQKGTCKAQFIAFTFFGQPVYTNSIHIQTHKNFCSRNEEEMTISRDHEAAHALQLENSLDLWASPFNNTCPAALSPLNGVLASLLTEIDAYGTQAFLAALRARSNPKFFDASNKDLVSVGEFEDICLQSPDLGTAIRQAGLLALSKIQYSKKPGGSVRTFFEHYCDDALKNYESNNIYPRDQNWFKFVQLGPEGRKIGNTLGFDCFGKEYKEFLAELKTALPPRIVARIEHLNRRFGISNEQNLPTFEEVLRTDGYGPEEYKHNIKSGKPYIKRSSAPLPLDPPLPQLEAA